MGEKGAKSAARTVAGMATMSRNSTTTDHRLGGSAEAAAAAAALSPVVGRRAPALLRGLLLLLLLFGLGADWDLPGRSKANLMGAAMAEFVAERIGCSRCIGCREVPF